MEKDLKVRKSNVFVDGRYRFTANEQKVLLQVISRIQMDDKDFRPYRVSWKEIRRATNNKINTAKKVDAVCETLKNKTVKIRRGKSENNFGFLSGWEVVPGKYVEFRIDPGMRELLLDLLEEGNFTLYDLECVLSLNSAYSIRMYEILKSQLWKKQPIYLPLDDLKWKLDIDLKNKSYIDFGNFRQFVLNKAQKDLKAHTDIQFTYETEKDGRRIGGLLITIRENKKYQRTVQGSSGADAAKAKLKPGDIILIAGKEYELMDGGIYYGKGAVPHGQLLQWIQQGKAKIKGE